jgi:DNA-binding transcriptional LysR family regulator
MDTGRHLAREGVGVGFFTRTFVAEDLAEGRLVEVAVTDFPAPDRPSALVRPRRSLPLSEAAALLAATVQDEARRLGLVPGPAPR